MVLRIKPKNVGVLNTFFPPSRRRSRSRSSSGSSSSRSPQKRPAKRSVTPPRKQPRHVEPSSSPPRRRRSPPGPDTSPSGNTADFQNNYASLAHKRIVQTEDMSAQVKTQLLVRHISSLPLEIFRIQFPAPQAKSGITFLHSLVCLFRFHFLLTIMSVSDEALGSPIH